MTLVKKIFSKSVAVIAALIIIAGLGGFVLGSHSLEKNNDNKHSTGYRENSQLNEIMMSMPGMQGDRTRRFNVDWEYQQPVLPGTPNLVKFRVFDAANGNPAQVLIKNYTKMMHLIVVDETLTEYQHLHPEYVNGWFETTLTLPKEGRYNFYLDFVPIGAIEQQIGMSFVTSGYVEEEHQERSVDLAMKEDFGYAVNIDFEEPLSADKLSKMAQVIAFKISKDGQPVSTLRPYLAAFGHMVMINAETFEYYHVHPVQNKELKDSEIGGPKVAFAPMAVYQKFKPGIYRIFAQFNPDGILITAPFTVKVE